MNKNYIELLSDFSKLGNSLIKFNLNKTKDLFNLRKELYLVLKRLDNYLEIKLSRNANIVIPICPLCGSLHIKKHGYLIKSLYCIKCHKSFQVNHKNNANKKIYCPHCHTFYLTKFDFESARRFKCLDCNKTFNNAENGLGNRLHKDNTDKILKLIMMVANDNKYSIPQILTALDISMDTFYKWQKKILDVLPQLNSNFKRKST